MAPMVFCVFFSDIAPNQRRRWFWWRRWYFQIKPHSIAFKRATDHPNPLRTDRDRSKRNPASLTISRLVKNSFQTQFLTDLLESRCVFKCSNVAANLLFNDPATAREQCSVWVAWVDIASVHVNWIPSIQSEAFKYFLLDFLVLLQIRMQASIGLKSAVQICCWMRSAGPFEFNPRNQFSQAFCVVWLKLSSCFCRFPSRFLSM